MSGNRSSLYDTMRGGQIVFHYIRMTMQVITKNSYIFLGAVVLSAVLFLNLLASDESLRMGLKYAGSYVKTEFLFGEDDKTTVTTESGRVIKTTWGMIYKNQAMKNHFSSLKDTFVFSLILSIFMSFVGIIIWFRYLQKKGNKESDDDYVRGAKLGDIESHNKLIKSDEKDRGDKSRLTIAGVKLPPRSDLTSIAFVGSPGVGKSASILDILRQQRELGDKNFILDPGGEFTRKFYREGKDIILSPRDKRSVYWDVWSEGESPESYNTTSSSLIAEEKEGDFFSKAARFVFEAVADKLSAQARVSGESPSLQKLTNYILRVDDETLVDIVKNSDARSVLNMSSEKTAASIRATLSTYLQPLAKLPKYGKKFSFRDWLESDDDSWVFVPLLPKHRSYYRPVLTMWMEHFTMSVLSLPIGRYGGKRFNLHCDELTSYNKIPSLLMFLAESRKYCGNSILGFQNKSQLEMIYGVKGAEAMEGLIGTYGVFRCNSTKDSKWSSELLLSSEMEKSSESLSFGSSEVRDSVSVNKSVKDHRLVTPSEIVNLKDLELYLRFGKGYDVLKVTQEYPKIDDIAEALSTITDEEIAHKSMLDHHDSVKNKGNSEDLTLSNGGESEPSTSVDSENLPPEYEEFAALIDSQAMPDNSDYQEPDSAPKPEDLATTSNDTFTRGF